MTLLAAAAMTAASGGEIHTGATPAEAATIASQPANSVERGGFADRVLGYWTLAFVAPLLLAMFVRFSGGE